MKVSKILAAVDLAALDHSPLEDAVALAEKLAAEVVAVAVMADMAAAYAAMGVPPAPDVIETARRAAQSALDAFVARVGASRPRVQMTAVVREGVAWREIDAVQVERGCDLVVIGTHQRKALSRAVLGSVAAKVVRTSKVPVLTTSGHAPLLPIARVLAPVDFSPLSEQALDFALELAAPLGASVTALYVFEPPDASFASNVPPMPDYLEGLEIAARDAMAALVAARRAKGATLEGKVRVGVDWQEVDAEAKDHQLVVMGTHGRRGVSHLLLGSVAEKVVRTSAIPVLTVR
jgi:nucleotide-binding universal stress UspA family protein